MLSPPLPAIFDSGCSLLNQKAWTSACFLLSMSQLPAGLTFSHLAPVWFRSLLPVQAHLFFPKVSPISDESKPFLASLHLAPRLCMFLTLPLAQRVGQRKLLWKLWSLLISECVLTSCSSSIWDTFSDVSRTSAEENEVSGLVWWSVTAGSACSVSASFQ